MELLLFPAMILGLTALCGGLIMLILNGIVRRARPPMSRYEEFRFKRKACDFIAFLCVLGWVAFFGLGYTMGQDEGIPSEFRRWFIGSIGGATLGTFFAIMFLTLFYQVRMEAAMSKNE